MRIKDVGDPFALLKDIYNTTFDYCIISFDLDGKVTTWNVGAERITGFSSQEMIGQNIIAIYTAEDRLAGEPQDEREIAMAKGRAEDHRWHLRKDGSRFFADGVLTLTHNTTKRHAGYLKIFRDITDRKLAEAETLRAATSDMLTGLANRYSFEAHGNEMVAIAMRSRQLLALHLIDLDGFKQVNDSFGHQAGDQVLKQVAQRILNAIRSSDFSARLGGDEFVVLQPNMASASEAGKLAAKLNEALSRPYRIGDREVLISGSIGIALCPGDAADLDHLQKKADLAMYRSKAQGNNTYSYFTKRLDEAAHQRARDHRAIAQALANDQFYLAYQPRIASSTGCIQAMKALLRCSNAALADYPTEYVVELGIEAGVMKELSLRILREACEQLQRWKRMGMAELKMCINLTTGDVADPFLTEYLDEILERTGLSGADLEIELTERYAMGIQHSGMEVLDALRSRGIGINIDDFGIGHSALGHLVNSPVTGVKLDRSLLSGVPQDPQRSAVAKAMVGLTQALELQVIAEGVETREQAAFLRENHCDALQGFLFAAPLPSREMTIWLSEKYGAAH